MKIERGEVKRTESPCLRYGWGLCLKCSAGFPQYCQCKATPKRKPTMRN